MKATLSTMEELLCAALDFFFYTILAHIFTVNNDSIFITMECKSARWCFCDLEPISAWEYETDLMEPYTCQKLTLEVSLLILLLRLTLILTACAVVRIITLQISVISAAVWAIP